MGPNSSTIENLNDAYEIGKYLAKKRTYSFNT